jgi:putative methyltransferase (TIGR04325 family)
MHPLKQYFPPIFVKFLTGLMYGWSGNYKSWQEAQNKCSGYDSDIIINRVKDSMQKVKNGEAVFERDSVLFDEIQYSYPLLSALQQVALKNDLNLNVLDFGGSLGSCYFQNKGQLEGLKGFSWNIIEQEHFVTEGKRSFEDETLKFYYNIDDCLKEQKVNAVLLSSVLQYIEKPYQLLDELMAKKVDYIIIDRTPVFKKSKDRITVQKVPKKIYEAQYPCWILNQDNVLNHIVNNGYDLVYDAVFTESINLSDAHYKGYFFKLK